MKFEWVLSNPLPPDFLKAMDSLGPGSVVFLEGEMGAGKTTLVREICLHWGIVDVASPTYAFHSRSLGPNRIIDHWDLYRIRSEEDLDSTGFWDQVPASDGICFIEWPERAPGFLPPGPFVRIKIAKSQRGRWVEFQI